MAFKDWKEGEARVKAHIVLSSGASLNLYLPHLTPEQGEIISTLLVEILVNRSVTLLWTDRKTGEVRKMSASGTYTS
jgi:hypothetical protein